MKIILFSRPTEKSSVENFGALLESIEAHNFEWVVNSSAAEWLAERGIVATSAERCYDAIADVVTPDSVVISYGGDGTLLSAVRSLGGAPTPILGINSGRLGFLATVSKEEFDVALDALAEGNYCIEQRSMLRIEGDFDVPVTFPLAFNEFSIQRSHMGMIGIKVEIDGRLAANYWSDGALIATPTGSTAYALSAGGPVVAPSCTCLVIAPLAPHNLTMRPVVVPDTSRIRLKVRTRHAEAFATLDNRSYAAGDGAEFVIGKAEKPIFLAVPHNISFYDALRNKMMWGVDIRG